MTEVFLSGEIMNFSSFLSDFVNMSVDELVEKFGASLDFLSVSKLFIGFMVIVLGMSLIGRLFFGRSSALTRSVAASISILLIYVVTVIVYILRPWSLEKLLSPLPYVSFCAQALVIHPFEGIGFSSFAGQFLAMIELSFLVIISSGLISSNSNTIRWFISHFLSIVLAMLLHLVANWAIKTYLPTLFTQFSGTVLFILLMIALLGGIMKLILSVFLSTIHPLLGFLYAFFFSNRIGKCISMSILSAFIVTVVFSIIEYLGFAVIFISPRDLISYVPLGIGLIILWYLIGHEL